MIRTPMPCSPSSLARASLFTLALALPALTHAQAGQAHQHGVGQFNLVVDGNVLEIDIIVPGADILGFEHAAQTPEEQQAVTALKAALTAQPGLIRLPEAAQCERVKAVAHTAAEHNAGQPNNAGHEQHGHDEHNHPAHSHDHKASVVSGHTKPHDHSHEQHSANASHTEWHVHYRYECQQTAALNGLTLTWFDQFPASQELQVQALTPNRQIGGQLTPSQPSLRW